MTTITISMDKRCAECGKGGACDNGLCMTCTAKSLRPGVVMKSHIGRQVAHRSADVMAEAREVGRKLRGEAS